MDSVESVTMNFSNSYLLAISTLIAASLFALFYGIKNAMDEEEVVDKNGKIIKKKKSPAFFLPCSLNQECLFDDEELEEEFNEVTEEKSSLSKSALAEKNIKAHLTAEDLKREEITRNQQLSEIFQLMQEQGEKFGATSFKDVEEQLKIYRL